MAPFEFLDLSELTASLVKAIGDAIPIDPMWTGGMTAPPITVSGASPDSVRDSTTSDCQLTLYLFHVDVDAANRNSPLLGKRVPPIPFQPMSLNLYYLLTAYAKDNFAQEQQAMSIAIRWFHEHPIFSTVTGSNEFTLTLQPESADEIGRLWQSMNVAARLSTVYRVAVVFLQTPAAPPPDAKPVLSFEVVADPAMLPLAATGAVIGTERRVVYRAPNETDPRVYIQSPASAAPGQSFRLWGSQLGISPSDHLYLLTADGTTETEVTSWIVGTGHKGSKLTITLPATTGTPPANCPPPGVYQLRAGSDTPRYRSNATPFQIAPAVTAPSTPDVFLTPAAGVFHLTGANFVAPSTDVILGTVALSRINAGDPLNAGDFLAESATSIRFALPAVVPHGDYPVRIRVNQVEADSAWWVHA
jgi:uncharacterized protein DUF4255